MINSLALSWLLIELQQHGKTNPLVRELSTVIGDNA
jgi:hypothetical protein